MGKILMGPKLLFYPRPTLLVGANVDGKPNFMTVAANGVANTDPPMLSVAIRHHHYTLKGIRQNLTFSVNIPSTDLVKETDYCGIVSGDSVDKMKVCQFKVFYGKLNNTPMIEECPINLECKVIHILDLGTHALIIGRVEETHVSENCLTNGKPDVNKINAFIYTAEFGRTYMALGQSIGEAHSIGRELQARGTEKPEVRSQNKNSVF